jgi:hypothetical protein
MQTDADMSGVNDQGDMADRLKGLQSLGWRDHEGELLCDEILIAALRRSSFNVREAADCLWNAKYPDPVQIPIPWTPSQRKFANRVMRDRDGRDGAWCGYTYPLIFPIQVEALQALARPDGCDERFTEERIISFLESTLFSVDLAAECLIGGPLNYPHARWWQPHTARQAEIDELRCSFRRLSYSTVAEVYDEANGSWPTALKSLQLICHENRV